jgi:pimeloyl-ACP methyl ester carboxylesterase
VGHSFGGVVALHTAALYPEMVAGLVLSDSFFPGLRHLEPDLGQSKAWQDLRKKFQSAGVVLPVGVDFDLLFRMVAELPPERMAELRKAMGATSAGWLVQLPRLAQTTCGTEAFAEAGLTAERIQSVCQPVAALYDEHSDFTATCRFLQEHLANCRVDTVPGARHLAPLENSGAFIELVQKHLRALAGLNPSSR